MMKIEKLGKALVDTAIKQERDGWPPVCNGIFFQPERPSDSAVTDESSETN